jgi:hypothetical protein
VDHLINEASKVYCDELGEGLFGGNRWQTRNNDMNWLSWPEKADVFLSIPMTGILKTSNTLRDFATTPGPPRGNSSQTYWTQVILWRQSPSRIPKEPLAACSTLIHLLQNDGYISSFDRAQAASLGEASTMTSK